MAKKSKSQKNRIIKIKNRFAELKGMILQLETANDNLKKVNSLKDEFVSLATHQIRGPLGAIKGYISLILEGDYGSVPEKLVEPLNIILKSTDTLGKTVNDFLDVSRIEQEEMKFYLKSFDLADLVNETVNEMRHVIKSRNLELKLNLSKELLLVHGDKAKLKQVFSNLLDNACKYTKTGWIEIELSRKLKDRVLFIIKDSGMGIKVETMPNLFKKFSRCSDASKTNTAGTGLGLYIAKKMTEANKGRIWAESEGEGRGSQFYVELPLVE